MKSKLIHPAALLAIEILQRSPSIGPGPWSADVIASAFQEAYDGLAQGLNRVALEEALERSKDAPQQP